MVDNGSVPMGELPTGVWHDEFGFCCSEHCSAIEWSKVRGTKTQKECGPLCWEATGSNCKCSCAGVDHGCTA